MAEKGNLGPQRPTGHLRGVSPLGAAVRSANAEADGWAPLTSFSGEGSSYFGILLRTILFSVLTMGVYSFWGKTWARKYLWNCTAVLGEPLEYTGTGRELFISLLIVGPVLLALWSVAGFILYTAPSLLIIVYPIFLYLWPFASYRALRYRLTRHTRQHRRQRP